MSVVTKADIDAEVAGRTVATEFRDRVATSADAVALRWRDDDGAWFEWTWADYADRARRAATGLAALGIGHGDRVVLMMRNRPEFHVLDVAAVLVGATPVSIYNSSSPEQISYLVNDCGAKAAIAEDAGFLEKFLKVSDELPTIEHLLIVDDPDGVAGAEVTTLAALLGHEPIDLDAAATTATPDDLATMIYTSGTTGPSKGVMLSHYNVVWTTSSYQRALGDDFSTEGLRVVSYLPMAHIAERMVSHYLQIGGGLEVSCCPEPSKIGPYIGEVKPEVIFGVPRVWEKIHAAVTGALSADPDKAQQFADGVAAAAPLRNKLALTGSLDDEEQATLDFLDAAAFAPLREMIGLDACAIAVTGAAPIPAELMTWFRAVGVPLSEVYGLSECTGPMTWDAYRVKPGTVGRAMPGVEVALAEDGEVIGRGGNIFGGYLGLPDKTAEALDADGWLHTGDIGEFDDEGYLKIVDRKKELIITAGGKNISPANLEAALKTIPLVGQACAIGDGRKFMSALVVLDPEVAPGWAAQHGLGGLSLAELAAHPDVIAEIEAGVAEANKRFNSTEQIKKVTVLGEEWMPDSDLLTPTSKLKRRGILARYDAEIEAMYA